jgi:hypothetical protein
LVPKSTRITFFLSITTAAAETAAETAVRDLDQTPQPQPQALDGSDIIQPAQYNNTMEYLLPIGLWPRPHDN